MLTKSDLKNIGDLMDQKIKPLSKDIKGLKKDFKVMSRLFDHDYLTL